MFDYVCIFTTGGILLWSKAFYAEQAMNVDLINVFIKSMLLENSHISRKQYSYQDYMLKWQINQDLKLVFTVVYKEILQLAFVEQFLGLLSKAFIAGVYEKALVGDLTRDQVLISICGRDSFSDHYALVYQKWDAIVQEQQTAPKKMRSFAETSKGKKLARKKGSKPLETPDKKPSAVEA